MIFFIATNCCQFDVLNVFTNFGQLGQITHKLSYFALLIIHSDQSNQELENVGIGQILEKILEIFRTIKIDLRRLSICTG